MKYDPKRHHRRSIRWVGYDYAEAGVYFVTVCVQDHLCLFGDVINDEMRLNDAGCMIQAVWGELPSHYPAAETDAFVVMPNHIHATIRLIPGPVGAGPCACPNDSVHPRHDGTGQPQGVAPTEADRYSGEVGQSRTGPCAMSLADVVHRFKTLTTKRYADGVKQQGWPAFHGRLWQRNYYEHVIRGDESLNRIQRYIADNPASWAFDEENPQVKSHCPPSR